VDAKVSPRGITTSANKTVTCLYSADRLTCVTGTPHSLQNLEFGGSSVPPDPHDSPADGQRTPTTVIHVSIVSPLVNDVRHIAVPSLTRSFETLVCRLFRNTPYEVAAREAAEVARPFAWVIVVARAGIEPATFRF
jgi:hypothetical protein